MNFKRLFSGVMTAALAGTAAMLPLTSVNAGEAPRFSCLTKQGVPATVALTKRGPVPVIVWQSTLGDGVYTPQVRCDIVSKRFQQFYQDGTLNFLTTGRKNRLPIVCVAQRKGGPCAQDLFTLKPGANPGRTLRRLMAVRVGAGGPLNESAARTYIDLNNLLETAPVDNSIEVPGETATQPSESVETATSPTAVEPPVNPPVEEESAQPENSTQPAPDTQVAPDAPESETSDGLW